MDSVAPKAKVSFREKFRGKFHRIKKLKNAWNDARTVAVVVDLDNLKIDLDQSGYSFSPAKVFEVAQRYGTVSTARIFCHFTSAHDSICTEAHMSGFRLIECPKLPTAESRERKDTVDEVMRSHITEIIERYPEIDVFVVGTVDRNFAPSITDLKQKGKYVVVLYGENPSHLVETANESVSIVPEVSVALKTIELHSWNITDSEGLELVNEKFPGLTTVLGNVVRTSKEILNGTPSDFRKIRNYTWNHTPGLKSAIPTRDAYNQILRFMINQNIYLSRGSKNSSELYSLNLSHPLVAKSLELVL